MTEAKEENYENMTDITGNLRKEPTYLAEPIVVKTYNRSLLDEANIASQNALAGQIFSGKHSITVLTEEAAKKFKKVTGYVL